MSANKLLDLCCGAGGATLGFKAAGFDVFGVEKDRFAWASHSRGAGPCALADIEEWEPRETFNVVFSGVPCQPFSIAGGRLDFADPRAGLFKRVIDIANICKAGVLIFENVPRLYDKFKSVFLDAMLYAGFKYCDARVLCAADYGVPQLRHRAFFVGSKLPWKFEWPIPTAEKPVTLRQFFGWEGEYNTNSGDCRIGMRHVDPDSPYWTVLAQGTPEYVAKIGEPRRRISIQEEAMIQGFPEDFFFYGSKFEQRRQIGNAVPVMLAKTIGNSLARTLQEK